MKGAPLLSLLLLLGASPASALVRLGEKLPPHPWTDSDDTREIVVVYSHDCGDLGGLWQAILNSGLPVRAVNAEDVASPAPQGVSVWRGDDATAFARKLRLEAYPTVLLVNEGRILNAWEGTFGGKLE
ncbi:MULTISPECIES: penicillin-binding protein [Deinococcus]|uniref:Penicillin-binding protein n=1 Tax=Deinococcus cavernae TaxID=2320857 RepID=A0A418VB24_9DEIO|nr:MULTISPECIES: penicillin-binding protein [Deinococcus]RJF73328.1 penicillin-binding protein [Deinococcus cavernae]